MLHIVVGLAQLILLEGAGQWYVHAMLKAPADRIGAASILLHCITLSTFVNVVTVPYEALINAREDMHAIALINIVDALLKLGIAVAVVYASGDKLVVYGVLTALLLVGTLTAKRVYCLRRYAESHFRWHRIGDLSDMRSMGAFAVWNLIGAGTSAVRSQGTAVVLNRFFALAVNAAYGVALQVNGLLLFFANSIVRAIRPQIVKSEGAGEHGRMLRLSCTTCRITSLMVALLAIPLGVAMPAVLRLWLGESVNAEMVMFCRGFLVVTFVNQLTFGLQIALESVGRIRTLQCLVGSLHALPVAVAWLCFRLGAPPSAVMTCIVVEELVGLVARSLIAQRQAGLGAVQFLLRLACPCALAAAGVTLLTWWAVGACHAGGLWSIALSFLVSAPALAAVSLCLLLSEAERNTLSRFFLRLAKR